MPETRKAAFVVLVVTAVAIELQWRTRLVTSARTGWLWFSLGCFVVAAGAWLLDWHRVACEPDGPFQLHSLWHVLSAPTIIGIDRYFVSESKLAADG